MKYRKRRCDAFDKGAGVLSLSSSHQTRPLKLSGALWEKLDAYQQNAVEFSLRARTAALFFEQGTGKTWIAAGVAEQLIEPIFSALFVVPLANLETSWYRTLKANLPGVSICKGLDAYSGASYPKILLIHYEALPRILKKVRRHAWHLIVYDESQRLKQRSTRASRSAAKLADFASYKLILSGTPIDKQPADLWGQFRFLNPDVFGRRWRDFTDRFLEPVTIDLSKYRYGTPQYQRMLRAWQIAMGRRKFDPARMDEFLSLIQPYALRLTKEVLDLPPLRIIEDPVVLVGEQRRVYRELEESMVSRVGDTTVMAPLRVTQLGMMQQVCGGHLIDEEGKPHSLGSAKLRRLKRRLAYSPLPAVVFCRYLEELESLRRELSPHYRVAVFSGRVPKPDRVGIIDRFQRGGLDVLLCQIKTGGVGLDLFRAATAFMYSLTYSFIDFEQAIARLHRRGQTRAVNIFLLYAEGTVDEVICGAIRSKRQVSDSVLEYLKAHRSNTNGKRRPGLHDRRSRQGS